MKELVLDMTQFVTAEILKNDSLVFSEVAVAEAIGEVLDVVSTGGRLHLVRLGHAGVHGFLARHLHHGREHAAEGTRRLLHVVVVRVRGNVRITRLARSDLLVVGQVREGQALIKARDKSRGWVAIRPTIIGRPAIIVVAAVAAAAAAAAVAGGNQKQRRDGEK